MSANLGFGETESSSSTSPGVQTQAGNQLMEIIKQMFGETEELRTTLADQMLEALQTGGIGAQIPLINRAVDASARATGGALKDIDADLAQSGLAGTPFGAALKAQTASQGKFDQSQIPLGFMAEIFKSIPGYLGNLQGAGFQGMAGAAGAEAGNQPDQSESKGYDWAGGGGVGK